MWVTSGVKYHPTETQNLLKAFSENEKEKYKMFTTSQQ